MKRSLIWLILVLAVGLLLLAYNYWSDKWAFAAASKGSTEKRTNYSKDPLNSDVFYTDSGAPRMFTEDNIAAMEDREAEERVISLIGSKYPAPRDVEALKLLSYVPPENPLPGTTAKVVLLLTIDEQGRVEECEIFDTTNERFNSFSCTATKQWLYSPPCELYGVWFGGAGDMFWPPI